MMSLWLTFGAAGLVTYFTRASFLLFGRNVELPDAVQRSLRFVAPAAFAAIAVPGILGDAGFARLVHPDPRLIAAAVAGLIVWRTRNVPVTLVTGMATLWLLQAVWPA